MDLALSLWEGKSLWFGHSLIRRRGRGGFGDVWEARDPEGELIALKFMPSKDKHTAAEEIRNILRIRELNHANLLRIHEVRADRGYVVVAMELADGSLADLMQVARNDFAMPLPAEHVCDYLSQAAAGLDFLNARHHHLHGALVGIQHGDVKPGNLVLCGNTVKLCDFGLARVTTADVVSHRRAGTTAYAAPEVFCGQISQWSDQYALAVTYAELRSGKLPFPNNPSRFSRVFTRSEPDLSALSSAEECVITRALSKTPQDRWPTCSDMMSAMSKALALSTMRTAG